MLQELGALKGLKLRTNGITFGNLKYIDVRGEGREIVENGSQAHV